MRAVQLIEAGRLLELVELPIPEPGPRDVLVKVCAAGICHSDAHYRSGRSPANPLPLTLGHEVAGIVAKTGRDVSNLKEGDRVCIHYLATCGDCEYCLRGQEQFCRSGAMMGKHRNGGFADYVVMPGRSVFRLPEEVPFVQGAILMCSSATALHSLNQAHLRPGETVAVFGIGGLGCSAIRLAQLMGAGMVFAVDIRPEKLELARELGAISVSATAGDPVREILRLTSGRGVDVALEMIGLPTTIRQAISCLAIRGRAALAGITEQSFEVWPYRELINKEAEIIGVSDHVAQELPFLLETAKTGKLNLAKVVTRTVPLEAGAINEVLDNLDVSGKDIRVVVQP
jgi:propanol-preferring alcohol dehydrogenase